MATKRIKHNENEKLDAANIERVIAYLTIKGSTKKVACEMLNINYNTTRLGTIIDKYLEDKKRDAERRAEKRGKPPTEGEISYTIKSYLEGDSVESISNSLYRGTTFVHSILSRFNVPIRQPAHSYNSPELIPDEAVKTKFALNEQVYSARYDSLARIRNEFQPGVYGIYLLSDKWLQNAYQPWYELASLEHIKQYL